MAAGLALGLGLAWARERVLQAGRAACLKRRLTAAHAANPLFRASKGKPTTVDAVTLGDAWLQRAIAEGLIQPIPNAREYRWWVSVRGWAATLACRMVAHVTRSVGTPAACRRHRLLISSTHHCLPRCPSPAQAQLYPRWQQLVRRDAQGRLDPRGEVWAAPYRWGATLVAYRWDKLGRWAGW